MKLNHIFKQWHKNRVRGGAHQIQIQIQIQIHIQIQTQTQTQTQYKLKEAPPDALRQIIWGMCLNTRT